MDYQSFAAFSGVLFLLLAVLQVFQIIDKYRLHKEIARKSALISSLYKRVKDLESRLAQQEKEAVE